jgi:protein-tyrosine phosphatase
MPAVLFVCTANQFRSPLAAACFSRKLSSLNWRGDWIIQSAGTWASPGISALPVAIVAARKLGVSLEDHRTRCVTSALVSTQDLILVMESGQKEAMQSEFAIFSRRMFLLSEVVQNKAEDISDPVMSDTESYIETAIKIHNLIERGFYRICGRALKTGAVQVSPAYFDSASAA